MPKKTAMQEKVLAECVQDVLKPLNFRGEEFIYCANYEDEIGIDSLEDGEPHGGNVYSNILEEIRIKNKKIRKAEPLLNRLESFRNVVENQITVPIMGVSSRWNSTCDMREQSCSLKLALTTIWDNCDGLMRYGNVTSEPNFIPSLLSPPLFVYDPEIAPPFPPLHILNGHSKSFLDIQEIPQKNFIAPSEQQNVEVHCATVRVILNMPSLVDDARLTSHAQQIVQPEPRVDDMPYNW
ncbi:hypothetical protein QAD02_019386 [Eretmocerus hayati]|uniref:Uncharacterized protein n=1 Tax=Eretmocerus hayati TaxID=131215 RepID=A0ACC2PJW3_9HYME|nr:hypothetical protein QAD02_019386 [Eretmocerus hayati]